MPTGFPPAISRGTRTLTIQQVEAEAFSTKPLPPERMGTGTANSSTYLRGDQVWATPASGSGNGVDVTVDFGSSFACCAATVVTGQAWVTGTSKIIATPKAAAGKASETSLFSFQPVVSDLSSGVGFTLTVYTPVKAKGTYTFSCIGV